MKKKADYDFGPDHELDAEPMNWRQGEGIGVDLRRISGDPKSFRNKLDEKIKTLQKRKNT